MVTLLLIPLVGACSIMFFEEKLIYFPSKYPVGLWDTERLSGWHGGVAAKAEDAWIRTEDGLQIHGWYVFPEQPGENGARVPAATRHVILWFHGNAGSIADRFDMALGFLEFPARVLMIDYRGYGRSEGSPSEKGLYKDARAAWNYLLKERGHRPEEIVLFGKSLGGGPAVQLATEVDPAGLIVQSSFTSIPDMASRIFPVLPRALIRTKMDSLSKIGKVRIPKLIVHSPADEVVPYDMGQKLFEAAAPPKTFYEVPNAGHNETYLVGGQAYWEVLRKFVDGL